MIELGDKNISVYLCSFTILVQNATILIKFPCHYFLEWKSINGKTLFVSDHQVQNNSNIVEFNQKLQIETQMLYDNNLKKFFKKETHLIINLVSKSRPDQVKLVGRVSVDLSELANNQNHSFTQKNTNKLTYCSVNADITFSAGLQQTILTDIEPNNLDKSSFNDYFSVHSLTVSESTKQLETSNVIKKNLSSPKLKDNKQDLNPSKLSKVQVVKYDKYKIDDSSFRTVSTKKQTINSKINNELFIKKNYTNQWLPQKQKLKEQIDFNKKQIQDLQKKVQGLCKTLSKQKIIILANQPLYKQKIQANQPSKQSQKKQAQTYMQKHFRSQKLQSQIKMIQSAQIYQSARNKQSQQKISSDLYNQRVSQTLEAHRLLQQNKLIIRELQSAKKQLEQRISSQAGEIQSYVKSSKQQKKKYENKLMNVQNQKRITIFHHQQKVKILSQHNQNLQLLNNEYASQKIKLQSDFIISQKKLVQLQQRLRMKQIQFENIIISLKQLQLLKQSFQNQSIQLKIQNEKAKQTTLINENLIKSLTQQLINYKQDHCNFQDSIKLIEKYKQQNFIFVNKVQGLVKQVQTTKLIKKQCENLIAQNKFLNFTLTTKINQLQNNHQQINKLLKEIQILENERSQSIKRQLQYDSQCKNLKAQFADLKISCTILNNQNTNINSQCTKLKEQIQQLNQIINSIDKQKDDLNQQLMFHVKSTQSSSSQLKCQLSIINKLYNQKVLQCEEKDKKIQYKIVQLANLAQRHNILQKTLVQSQQKCKFMQQKCKFIQEKCQFIQQNIKILQQQSKKIINIIYQKQILTQQVNELQQKVQQYLNVIGNMEQNYQELNYQKEDLQQKCLDQIDMLAECKIQIDEQNQIIQKYLYQINIYQLKIQQFQQIMQNVSQKITYLTQQIFDKNGQIRMLNEQSQQLKHNQDLLTKQLLKVNQQKSVKEVQMISQELNQTKQSQYKRKIIFKNSQLEQQISQLKLQKATLQIRLIQAQKMLSTNRKIQIDPISSQKMHQTIFDQKIISQRSAVNLNVHKNNLLQDQLSLVHSPFHSAFHSPIHYQFRQQLTYSKKSGNSMKYSQELDFDYVVDDGVEFNLQENGNPQLKIQKLTRILQQRNHFIRQLQRNQSLLKQKINQFQKLNIIKNSTNQRGVGKIKANSPKKSQIEEFSINSNIKLEQKVIKQSERSQIKNLKKTILFMQIQIQTLRSLNRQVSLNDLQIRLLKPQQINRSSRNHILNQSNKLMPSERSYLIKRNRVIKDQINQSLHNIKQKNTLIRQIMSQTNYNQTSKFVQFEGQYPNVENNRLQSKGKSSFFTKNLQQISTTSNQLKDKINQLQKAIAFIEQEKHLLENQIQNFQEEKFCLNSDLNQQQIQIFQLYRSILRMKQEIAMLKQENENYLKTIQNHQDKVCEIISQIQKRSLKMNEKSIDRLDNISMSKISHHDYSGQKSSKQSNSYLNSQLKQINQMNLLQDQITIRQQRIIYQNDLIYDKQNHIKQLYEKLHILEQQIQNLIKQQDHSKSNQILDNSVIIHQNQILIKENQNLKNQIKFLQSQNDNMNSDFFKLNALLYKRNQEISYLRIQLKFKQQKIANLQTTL